MQRRALEQAAVDYVATFGPLERRQPLRAPDVVLNLQAVFDRNYDAGAYSRKIDYTQDPVPPLEDEDAAWADALLREKRLR